MSTETTLKVVSVERMDGTGIIIEFSDGTCATFSVQELDSVKPDREKTNPPANGNGGGE